MAWGQLLGNVLGNVGGALAGSAVSSWLSDEPSLNITRQSALSPEQQQIVSALNNVLQREIGLGVQPYPGQTVAGPSPVQQLLYGQAGSLAQLAPALEQIGLGKTAYKGWDPSLARQRWEQTIGIPAREEWEEKTIPTIQEKFVNMGAYDSGGSRRAIAESGADLQNMLAGTLANALIKDRMGYWQHQAQQQNVGLSALDQALSTLQAMQGIGQGQRQVKQEMLQEPYQKWQYMQPYSNPWLNLISQGTQRQYRPENIARVEPGNDFTSSLAGPLSKTLGGLANKGIQGLFNNWGTWGNSGGSVLSNYDFSPGWAQGSYGMYNYGGF